MRKNIKRRISVGIVLLTILALMNESTAWAQPKTQPQSLEKPLGIPASIAEDISLDQLKTKRAAVEGAAGVEVRNLIRMTALVLMSLMILNHLAL